MPKSAIGPTQNVALIGPRSAGPACTSTRSRTIRAIVADSIDLVVNLWQGTQFDSWPIVFKAQPYEWAPGHGAGGGLAIWKGFLAAETGTPVKLAAIREQTQRPEGKPNSNPTCIYALVGRIYDFRIHASRSPV
jgi:hypothetical protein